MAVLIKAGESYYDEPAQPLRPVAEISSFAPGARFAKTMQFGEYLCALQPDTPDLSGLKVIRPGLQLAQIKRGGQLVPAHALAMALDAEHASHTVQLGEKDAAAFVRGEAVPYEGPKGYALILFENLPLGWAKAVEGRLQNLRPKGLRKEVEVY